MANCVGRILDGRGIRQDWLAGELGISASYMSRLLSGEKPWTDALKDEAARVLMVPRDVLFFECECSRKLQSEKAEA